MIYIKISLLNKIRRNTISRDILILFVYLQLIAIFIAVGVVFGKELFKIPSISKASYGLIIYVMQFIFFVTNKFKLPVYANCSQLNNNKKRIVIVTLIKGMFSVQFLLLFLFVIAYYISSFPMPPIVFFNRILFWAGIFILTELCFSLLFEKGRFLFYCFYILLNGLVLFFYSSVKDFFLTHQSFFLWLIITLAFVMFLRSFYVIKNKLLYKENKAAAKYSEVNISNSKKKTKYLFLHFAMVFRYKKNLIVFLMFILAVIHCIMIYLSIYSENKITETIIQYYIFLTLESVIISLFIALNIWSWYARYYKEIITKRIDLHLFCKTMFYALGTIILGSFLISLPIQLLLKINMKVFLSITISNSVIGNFLIMFAGLLCVNRNSVNSNNKKESANPIQMIIMWLVIIVLSVIYYFCIKYLGDDLTIVILFSISLLMFLLRDLILKQLVLVISKSKYKILKLIQ